MRIICHRIIVMATNLDSILKSRDITLPTNVCLVKAMVFPLVVYGCDSWTVKKAERWRIDAFELCCWRSLLRVAWTAWRFNQSIVKEISPGISLEGMMLKLKLQYFGHLMRRVREGNGTPLQYSCLENPMDGEAWKAAVHGVPEIQTWLSDITFTFTFTFMHWRKKQQPTPVFLPGETQGQGSLVGCCLWGRTESDTTEAT